MLMNVSSLCVMSCVHVLRRYNYIPHYNQMRYMHMLYIDLMGAGIAVHAWSCILLYNTVHVSIVE